MGNHLALIGAAALGLGVLAWLTLGGGPEGRRSTGSPDGGEGAPVAIGAVDPGVGGERSPSASSERALRIGMQPTSSTERTATPPRTAPATRADLEAAGEQPADLPPEASFPVRVRELGSLRPIAGATLQLRSAYGKRRLRTGDDGAGELRWPDGLEAALEVSHPDYLGLRIEAVRLGTEHTRELALELRPAAALVGRVVGVDGEALGAETADACELELFRCGGPDPSRWTRVPVDLESDGTFRVGTLEPGEYALAARGPACHAPLRRGIELEAAHAGEVVVELVRTATLRGLVVRRDEDRTPVADALVRVEPRDETLPHRVSAWRRVEAETGEDGAFELAGLVPGRATIRLRGPTGEQVSLALDVPSSGDPDEVTWQLPALAGLAGFLIRPDGAPAAGASVLARVVGPAAGPPVDVPVLPPLVRTCDGEGRFHFEELPVGRALALWAGSRARVDDPTPSAPLTIRVPPLDEGELRELGPVHLEAGARLSGRVVDPVGEPVPTAQVSLRLPSVPALLQSERTGCDEDGMFTFEHVPSASFVLEATAPGSLPVRERGSVTDGRDVSSLVLVVEPVIELRGRVTDREGIALGDARLVLDEFAADGTPARPTLEQRTDRFGRFQFRGVAARRFELDLADPRWRLDRQGPLELDLRAESGIVEVDLVALEKQRERSGGVRGEAVDAETGDPVLDLRVEGAPDGLLLQDGVEFELSGVPPGDHRLRLIAPGFLPDDLGRIVVRADVVHDVGRRALERATRLVVRVIDAAGEPVRGAKVSFVAEPTGAGGLGPDAPTLWCVERPGGTYEVPWGKPARWRLVVRPPGRSVQTQVVEVPRVEHVSFEVRIGS